MVDNGPHRTYLRSLIAALTRFLSRVAVNANPNMTKDGSTRMEAPLLLYGFHYWDPFPTPLDQPGALIYLEDGPWPAGFLVYANQYGDGPTWTRLGIP